MKKRRTGSIGSGHITEMKKSIINLRTSQDRSEASPE